MTNTTTKEQAISLYSKDFETDHLPRKFQKMAEALRDLFVELWASEDFPLHGGGCLAFKGTGYGMWVAYDGGILYDMLSPSGDMSHIGPSQYDEYWQRIDQVLGGFGYYAEQRNSWSFSCYLIDSPGHGAYGRTGRRTGR